MFYFVYTLRCGIATVSWKLCGNFNKMNQGVLNPEEENLDFLLLCMLDCTSVTHRQCLHVAAVLHVSLGRASLGIYWPVHRHTAPFSDPISINSLWQHVNVHLDSHATTCV